MHAVCNYGSYLQTYALSAFLKEHGWDSEIINYRFPTAYHKSIAKEKGSEVPPPTWLQCKIAGICARIVHLDSGLRLRRMDDFYEKNIHLTRPYHDAESLKNILQDSDVYITGSDQVWNPEWTGKDYSFLLSWVKDDKHKISYASSFAVKELPKEVATDYKKYLSRYDAISIRETSDILDKMGVVKYKVVLDPTFLLKRKQWDLIIPEERLHKKKYILCYILRYMYDPFPYAHKVIKWLKRVTGYDVVYIGPEVEFLIKGYKIYPNCGPLEFLNLFRNAEFVVTSSFHGTSFAINFEKPFFTLIKSTDTLDNRQLSLINLLHLPTKCVIKKGTPINELEMPKIDYSKTPQIEICRKESQDFLLNELSKIKS